MRIPFIHAPGTVGREDRLVRACIALSLLLLTGFAAFASGQLSLISIAFLVLGAYFSATAVLGRDPFYAHFAMDTRSDAELATRSHGHESVLDGSTRWVDLRESTPETPNEATGTSLLGN